MTKNSTNRELKLPAVPRVLDEDQDSRAGKAPFRRRRAPTAVSRLASIGFASWPQAVVRNRWALRLTYGMTLAELVAEACAPWAVGMAIDDLLRHRYYGLIQLLALLILHIVVELVRDAYDARLCARLQTQLATEMVGGASEETVDASTLIGRAALVRHVIEYFENGVPQVMGSIVGGLLALGFLTSYDYRLGLIGVGALVPYVAANWYYGARAANVNRQHNDIIEHEAEVIRSYQPAVVRRHFERIGRLEVRLTDTEVATAAVSQVFVLVAIALTLMVTTEGGAISVGSAVAILGYFWELVETMDDGPELLEAAIQARDVGRRFKNE